MTSPKSPKSTQLTSAETSTALAIFLRESYDYSGFFYKPEAMNYLRTHRLKTALTQAEVAIVVGVGSGANVSRHESGDRMPDLNKILAYAVLYDVSVADLFAEEAQVVETEIRSRARGLARRLRKRKPSPVQEKRVVTLRRVYGRHGRTISRR